MLSAVHRIGRLLSARPLEPLAFDIGGKSLPIAFRRHVRARRLVLRLNSEGTGATVTVPRGVTRATAIAFLERSHSWLAKQLEERGNNIRLRPGNAIPLHGCTHEIRHIASRRGTVTLDPVAKLIHVPGELPHVPRRLVDWMKAEARKDLTAASQKYAGLMGLSYRRISIRDQRSRWGSCSASGDLSFSWRLILTPPYVLDYVAAHEVAHLKHMNHGRAFWRLVLTHCKDAPEAKRWLKAHGHGVHRVVV